MNNKAESNKTPRHAFFSAVMAAGAAAALVTGKVMFAHSPELDGVHQLAAMVVGGGATGILAGASGMICALAAVATLKGYRLVTGAQGAPAFRHGFVNGATLFGVAIGTTIAWGSIKASSILG